MGPTWGSGGSPARIITAILLFWMAVAFAVPVHADSQRVLEYEYDGAGNIVGVRTGLNTGPPDVTSLQPEFINKESFAIIIATGVNLAGATVETTTPGLNILNFTVESETAITITLRADEDAVTGSAPLIFTTRVGEDSEAIAVAERTPVISTDPNPIVLEVDEQDVSVALLFDQPFTTDETFDLAVTDTDIATVTEQSITLPAGSREVTIQLTGMAAGNTTLEVNQLANFLAVGIPVIVAEPFPLPPGDHFIASRPMGVTTSRFELPEGDNTALSQPLGTLRVSHDLPPGNNQSLSGDLGIILSPAANQVTPSEVAAGTNVTLTITGIGLEAVTAANILHGDGVSQPMPFSVNGDGTELQIFLDLAGDAGTGLRRIVLSTANGTVPFSEPGGDLFEVTP